MLAFLLPVTRPLYTARMTSNSSLRVVVLGSGSAGNATVVSDGTTNVLVDCGFSALEVSKRLSGCSISGSSIDAILVTHEHGDHVRGIDVFCRRHAPTCAVWATAGTSKASALQAERTQVVKAGEAFTVGTLTVIPFATSHDAAEPVGYRIESGGAAVGIATDTGVMTHEAYEALSGCSIIGIESNHDERMLDTGPYPTYLKRRIRSTTGHLSNTDAADAVQRLAHDGLLQVFALHRSRTNNTKDLAAVQLRARLAGLGLKVPVTVAGQSTACDSDPGRQSLFG